VFAVVWKIHPTRVAVYGRWCTFASLCIPLTAWVVTMAVPPPDCDDDNYFLVNFRLLFRCFPLMPTMALEWTLIWGHFVFGSVLIMILVEQVLTVHLRLSSKAGASSRASSRGHKEQITELKKLGSTKIKLQVNPFKYLRKGTEKLVCIGSLSCILLIVNLIVNASLIVRSDRFLEKQQDEYFKCIFGSKAQTFQELVLECQIHTTEKLPASFLALGFFATSFSSLCFCAVFACDRKNLALLKVSIRGLLFRRNHGSTIEVAPSYRNRSEHSSEHTFGTIHATKGGGTGIWTGEAKRPEPWRGEVERPAPRSGDAERLGFSKGEDEVRCVNPPELPGSKRVLTRTGTVTKGFL
jgi:hypothetical protein